MGRGGTSGDDVEGVSVVREEKKWINLVGELMGKRWGDWEIRLGEGRGREEVER